MNDELTPGNVPLNDQLGLVPERTEGDAPICPWCGRQGWDTCQHADDARTCGK